MKKINNCIDCGSKIDKRSKRCRSCETKRKYKTGILNNKNENHPMYRMP